ncbi:MAG: hypothetical protein ACO1SV_21695 [Fimbriimonas sp.]
MAKLPAYLSVERVTAASFRIKVKTWHPAFWLLVLRTLLGKS